MHDVGFGSVMNCSSVEHRVVTDNFTPCSTLPQSLHGVNASQGDKLHAGGCRE